MKPFDKTGTIRHKYNIIIKYLVNTTINQQRGDFLYKYKSYINKYNWNVLWSKYWIDNEKRINACDIDKLDTVMMTKF